jgi:hypothetical protein
MPEKVMPKINDFEEFKLKMERHGFRMISGNEFRKEFRRLGLIAPRPLKGRETGFFYFANKISVVIWTTWLAKDFTIREDDSGWIVIKQDDEIKPIYFGGPFHRTKNFFFRLYQGAWLAHFRATNRPTCPKCSQFMKIKKGKAMKSRFWSCQRAGFHSDKLPFFLDWDFGLPQAAKKFVEAKRKLRAKRIKKLKNEGKEPYSAMKKRKHWIITKPENLP